MVNGKWPRSTVLQPHMFRLRGSIPLYGGLPLNGGWVMNQAYLFIEQSNYSLGYHAGANLVCCRPVGLDQGAQRSQSMPHTFSYNKGAVKNTG
jgi:hypothetical protein